MCAKNSLCYYFLKWQWLWSKCTKAKNRQKVQGIAGLLERYAQIKLNIPISWEKRFLHWSQYHKLISSIIRNLLPLERFLFFYSSRYNTWLRGRRSSFVDSSWKNLALNQELQVVLSCSVRK